MTGFYLFTLEIAPLEVGKTYDELPSHLTLMSRFLSDITFEELTNKVRPLFAEATPIHLVFAETIQLGPKKVTAHMVSSAYERRLRNKLCKLLDAAKVKYQYPEFIGENHKPHVTAREGVRFDIGNKRTAHTAYLIEVINTRRVIRSQFRLCNAY
jgi:hypothetical protein